MKINKHLLKVFFIFSVLILIASCKKDDDSIQIDESEEDIINAEPNILFIMADDMGKDATFGFSEGSIKPNTPNLNAIKNSGLSFNNFWVNPTCTPTRGSIITGKYGFRTGLKWAGDQITTSEKILQKFIKEETNNKYVSALVGKWHLSGNNQSTNPENFGLDYYAGILSGAVQDYYNWRMSEDGSSSNETTYATEELTNKAIGWIGSQEKPWFMWLAYNAPHTPFHIPPTTMHSQGALPEYRAGLDALPYYFAAIEAMDFQIGKLLASIPENELENTIIIFLGDNGTPNQTAQTPYSNQTVKGTLYQGGINTPMFISGYGVNRTGMDNNLIVSTDLYTTISNLCGIQEAQINDSKSFLPLLTSNTTIREFQYSEMDNVTNDSWAIRNSNYKLIVNANGNEQMFDMIIDPYEQNNLLLSSLSTDQQTAKNVLELELSEIRQ